jgi:predicted DNA-binding protein
MSDIADGEVRMAFKFIKNRIDRDSERYENICTRRREYGKRGGKANGGKSKQMEANATISYQMLPNESKSEQVEASEADKDKDKDKDKDLQESKDSMSKDIIPPMPPKGGESQKKKPLWKESYEEWKRLFLEAKDLLLNDSEFKSKQESYYPNIDYEKSIEKGMDYWLDEDTWKKVARERTQTIKAKERLKKNFDKNRIYKSKCEQEYKMETTFIERHSNFVQWIAEQVKVPNVIMPILHVTLDDFIEMINSCGGDSAKLAKTTMSLLSGKMSKGESLISAFRRNKE